MKIWIKGESTLCGHIFLNGTDRENMAKSFRESKRLAYYFGSLRLEKPTTPFFIILIFLLFSSSLPTLVIILLTLGFLGFFLDLLGYIESEGI